MTTKPVSVGSLKKGNYVVIEGAACIVSDTQTSRPGKHGHAKVRLTAVGMVDGKKRVIVLPGHDNIDAPIVEKKIANVLSISDDTANVMDNETYEQPAINASIMGDSILYLKEGLEVKLTFYGTEPLDIELPTAVELEVVEAEMAVKGDTATGANKSVTTETGLKVTVPLFVETGDVIRIDTRTGEYVTRV